MGSFSIHQRFFPKLFITKMIIKGKFLIPSFLLHLPVGTLLPGRAFPAHFFIFFIYLFIFVCIFGFLFYSVDNPLLSLAILRHTLFQNQPVEAPSMFFWYVLIILWVLLDFLAQEDVPFSSSSFLDSAFLQGGLVPFIF